MIFSRLFALLCFLLFSIKINAQHWQLLLKPDVENRQIQLDYTTIEGELLKGKFLFSNSYPHHFDKISPQDYVTDFFVFYSDESTDTVDVSKGFVEFKKPVSSFSYKVLENYGYDLFFPTTNYFRNDLVLISMPYSLIFQEGNTAQKIEISVFENDTLNKVLGLKSIDEWMQSPLALSATHNFSLSETLQMKAFANKLPVPKDVFFDLLGKAVFSTQYFQRKDNGLPKQLFFIFDTLESKSGAISLDNAAIFYFNENSISNFQYTILKTVVHEMLHWYLPAGNSKTEPQNLWVSEAAPEYLAIKSLFKAGIISERKFLEEMQSKISLSHKYKELGLEQLSIAFKSNPEFYEAFYSKGVVAMWLLDNVVQQNSNFTLEKLMMGDFKFSDQQTLLKLNDAMAVFEKEIVQKNPVIDFNQFLPYWGLVYEKQRPYSYTATQDIELVMVQNQIMVVNPADVKALEKGDVIQSVNGLKKIKEIEELLSNTKISDFEFAILRNGQKLKVNFSSPKQSKIVYDAVSVFPNASKEQKEAWKRYAN